MKDLSQRLARFILALSCYSAEGEWAERAGRAEAALLSGCVCGIIALDVKIHLENRYPYFFESYQVYPHCKCILYKPVKYSRQSPSWQVTKVLCITMSNLYTRYEVLSKYTPRSLSIIILTRQNQASASTGKLEPGYITMSYAVLLNPYSCILLLIYSAL